MGLATALQEAGLSGADVLAAAGLSPTLLDAPARFAAPNDYLSLWAAIRAVSGDPNIGIRLARSVRPDITEPLFLAMINAPDVAGAIDVVARFRRLLDPQDLEITGDEAGAKTLVYEWPTCEVAPPQALIDAELALLVELCRRGTGDAAFAPVEVQFAAPRLEAGSDHAEFFACPLRFGGGRNAMVFTAADLERNFQTHNPDMLNALMPYLLANTPPESTVARVRSAISKQLRGRRPDAGAVARELALSLRTMQRLLKSNATSFRGLLDEVRKSHADAYLINTSFSDGEIAFLLGFEDPNSFYRAYRSWHGRPPSAVRAGRQRSS